MNYRDTLEKIIAHGWTNFKRNSYLSIGTTGVMTLVLLLFAGLMSLNFISTKIVESLQDKVDISVYFKTDSTEEEVMLIKKDLENNSLVKNVSYISKDKALEDFKKLHAGDPLIQESLAELSENPLQPALNIKAVDPTKFGDIVTFLEGNKFRSFIDKINYYENEAVISRVQSITSGVRNWGLIISLLLALVAVMVTFNTIRLTIYNQRNEIEIMRLVGGSNWHIRAPYLIEGSLYGILAAVVTLVIFYPVIFLISPKLSILIPGISLMGYFFSNAIQFVLLLLIIGILLGMASSAIAIRRFLKI
ncbi:MAG: Cell division protein FtsX [Parcubacteria group bacterium GW2011_GWC1_39_29]|nr:MAG: Cell division protein FtsX [Parcubacteria group bacterium GW2011_GWC1_39_29]